MIQLSVTGLRVIAGVCVAGTFLSLLLTFRHLPAEVLESFSMQIILDILFIGLAVLLLSFWSPIRPLARWLGFLVGYLVVVSQVGASINSSELHIGITAVGSCVLVLMVGITALPLKPLHILAMALMIAVTYKYQIPSPRLDILPAMAVQMGLIATGLTVVVYRQRINAYRARRAAEESFEELRQAQSRLMISENAASQGRFAAALSHELNSPIGALSSALDTLLLAFRKQQKNPQEQERLEEVFLGATEAARQSCERLKETVGRMKQVSNLDRAETQVIDINQLWTSTLALLQGELEGKAQVTTDLKQLPPILCRPQQLSAVFSNLIRNAAAAIEEKGTIRLSSHQKNGDIVLAIQDDGRGISENRLAQLFDPAFQTQGDRISTTNWGLFTTRRIIIEHGGQIDIDSAEGRGTTVRILLPPRGADGLHH